MLFQAVFILMVSVNNLAVADEPDREFIANFRSYTSFSYLKTQFDQEKHLPELKSPLLTSGILIIDRANRSLTWEVTKPSHLLAEIKGNQVSIETGVGPDKSRQVYKMNDGTKADVDQESKSWQELSVFINFDPQKIVATYKVVKVGNLTYEFLAKNEAKVPFKKLVVNANKAGFLSRLEVHEISGDYFVLKFSTPAIVKR